MADSMRLFRIRRQSSSRLLFPKLILLLVLALCLASCGDSDDKGNTFPEVGDATITSAVPQYIGYLRRVKPAENAQGHALFDAPPRHYKLKILDEDRERTAYVDIPLSFSSESPDVPQQAPSK